MDELSIDQKIELMKLAVSQHSHYGSDYGQVSDSVLISTYNEIRKAILSNSLPVAGATTS